MSNQKKFSTFAASKTTGKGASMQVSLIPPNAEDKVTKPGKVLFEATNVVEGTGSWKDENQSCKIALSPSEIAILIAALKNGTALASDIIHKPDDNSMKILKINPGDDGKYYFNFSSRIIDRKIDVKVGVSVSKQDVLALITLLESSISKMYGW